MGEYKRREKSQALEATYMYLSMPNSCATDKHSEPKISTMRTEGKWAMLERAERTAPLASRMTTQRRSTTASSFSRRPERSAGGISRKSQKLTEDVADFRTWDSASEVWQVTARIVTLKLQWRARIFPSSITGMRWPRPGLESRATWHLCMISVDGSYGEKLLIRRGVRGAAFWHWKPMDNRRQSDFAALVSIFLSFLSIWI